MSRDTLYRSQNFAFFDSHHWEDWVELCCIANLDGETDVASMSDRLREERDTRKEIDAREQASDDSHEELDEAAKQDKQFFRVKSWFTALARRSQLLGDSYPFEIDSENSKLQLRVDITDAHRLYVALLMMSNLHYFGSWEADLTSSFESIGVEVFKWLLPQHAQVHRFGKGRGGGRYRGHIWNKIKRLADDLSCDIKSTKDQFAPTDNGDGGLDLVGWVPWADAAPGTLTLLGQCACTPDWARKQDEASGARWLSRIDFVTNPMTVILIPFFLRTPSGAWHRRTDFSGHLIVDRLRLLRALSYRAAELSALPSGRHVAACLAAKEEAF